MGNFARVAVPVAVAAAFPFATGAASLATVPITGGSIGAGTAGTTFIQGMNPWMIAANAGLAGLNEIGAMRQERYQQQVTAARSADEAERLRADYDATERRRRERLRAAVSAQRARFGATGLGAVGGSAAAVLEGLQRRSDADAAETGNAYNARRTDLLEAARPARRDNFGLLQKTLSPLVNLFD